MTPRSERATCDAPLGRPTGTSRSGAPSSTGEYRRQVSVVTRVRWPLREPERATSMTRRGYVHHVRGIGCEFVGGAVHQPQNDAHLGPQPLSRPAFLHRGPLGDRAVPLVSSERVDMHRTADRARLGPSGLSCRIGEALCAVPEVVENHGTPGLSRRAVVRAPAVCRGKVVGGACHGTPFAATARYLLAGYLKPVGPVARTSPMRASVSRRFPRRAASTGVRRRGRRTPLGRASGGGVAGSTRVVVAARAPWLATRTPAGCPYASRKAAPVPAATSRSRSPEGPRGGLVPGHEGRARVASARPGVGTRPGAVRRASCPRACSAAASAPIPRQAPRRPGCRRPRRPPGRPGRAGSQGPTDTRRAQPLAVRWVVKKVVSLSTAGSTYCFLSYRSTWLAPSIQCSSLGPVAR